MIRFRRSLALAFLAAAPLSAHAQGEPVQRRAPAAAAPAPPGPPVQRIATATAVSTERLGSIVGVRELPDGRLLLNDGARRRLLLMDTTLTVVGVVLDSLTDVAHTYGTRPGALIPFRGDSTLFVDPASYAMLVLDPAGRIARVRSVWRVEDIQWFTNPTGAFGWPGVDARGRIVYRVPARPARPPVPPPAGVPYIPPEPDSAFVVAVDLDTRKADTLASIRIPKSATRVRRTSEGRFTVDQLTNPLPSTDDWAVLPDGAVALVRGQDYRVEYLSPDGRWSSSAKLPFEWQRVTDEDKQRMVDSVKAAQQRQSMSAYVSAMIRWANQYRRPYPEGFAIPAGVELPLGLARDWVLPAGARFPEGYVYACAPGEEPTVPPGPGGAVVMTVPPGGAPPGERQGMVIMRGPPGGAAPGAGPGEVTMVAPPPAAVVMGGPPGAGGAPGAPGAPGGRPSCIPAPVSISGGSVPPPPTLRPASVMEPSELPDYRPPLPTGGAVRADAEGNLWIRTLPARPIPGGPVYDIVDRRGELVSRLQLPPGYTLAGFGRGKVVYLSMRDATGIHLARVRLR